MFEKLPEYIISPEILSSHLDQTNEAIIASGGLELINELKVKLNTIKKSYKNHGNLTFDYQKDLSTLSGYEDEPIYIDSYVAFCEAELPMTIESFFVSNLEAQTILRHKIVKVDSEGKIFGSGLVLVDEVIHSDRSESDLILNENKKLSSLALDIYSKQQAMGWQPIRPNFDEFNKYKFLDSEL
jgi:hypothetical protein